MDGAEILADSGAGDLAGDDEHGRGAGVGGGEAGASVEQPHPGNDEGDSGLSRDAGIAVRHAGGALLVASGDEADGGLIAQRNKDAGHVDATDTKDDFHAFAHERLHHGFAAAHQGHDTTPSSDLTLTAGQHIGRRKGGGVSAPGVARKRPAS